MNLINSLPKSYTIFGIDPGIAHCGITVIKCDTSIIIQSLNYSLFKQHSFIVNNTTFLLNTYHTTNKHSSTPQRLLNLFSFLQMMCKSFKPQIIFSESVYHFLNTKTINIINKVIGIIQLCSNMHNINIKLFSPTTIKKRFKSAKIDKKCIIKLCKKILNLPSKYNLRDDSADSFIISLHGINYIGQNY